MVSFCVLLTFLGLFDGIVGSRMMSWLYFLISSLTFFLTVLRISAYSIHCLSALFSTISSPLVIKVRVVDDILYLSGLLIVLATLGAVCVVDDILYLSGLLIVLATLGALCWTMSVMVSAMVSISSTYCSVLNRFLNSSPNLTGAVSIGVLPYLRTEVSHHYRVVVWFS